MARLSVVVCTRNDNHGGRALARFQKFLDFWHVYYWRYSLNMELIVVEWNPEPEKARLYEVLSWDSEFPIRFVEVPPEIHATIPNESGVPVWEYRGKNVGIRRAKGDWILSTNPDLIYSKKAIENIASLLLNNSEEAKGCYYRVTRADLENNYLPLMSIEDTLDYCEKNSKVKCGSQCHILP